MASKQPEDYASWSRQRLIGRVQELESQLRASNTELRPSTSPSPRPPKNRRAERKFDPSRYSTRLIALKLAYLGQRYNGFEHHANNTTPLPTIEEELFKALSRARLILPEKGDELRPGEVDWEGCEYSKCGRTDRGVSAFGQVIGVRVRSNRPKRRQEESAAQETAAPDGLALDATLSQDARCEQGDQSSPAAGMNVDNTVFEDHPPFDPVKDELPYSLILNNILPEDIRILAWCPSPPEEFSARFSCRERRYKYFFTQPAFAPMPGTTGLSPAQDGQGPRRRSGWLDIEAMREGARRFQGLHDFRNFCKIDPSKQLTNFERRIFHAAVEEVEPSRAPVSYVGRPEFAPTDRVSDKTGRGDRSAPDVPVKVYTFTLHGSAFLWHQVRHMVAILFLIGQGLESPSIISQLLDTQRTPTKPLYEMASDAPLVLWDCIFPAPDDPPRQDAMDWIYVGDETPPTQIKSKLTDGKFGPGGLVDNTWSVWRSRKIDEVLAGSLLDLVAGQGRDVSAVTAKDHPTFKDTGKNSQKVFAGDDGPRLAGRYVPVLQKPRMESCETVNRRWAEKRAAETDLKRQKIEQADHRP